ncbi:MAG: ribosomal protein S18-alanine N-acetyltransferase [Erysipelotrichales bacterium]|nr:ribosomal protein S18-alanine N-acetyltransferase [Erysipelotrichales bacterium]
MLIRPMKEEDLDKVLAIENNSFISPWNREQFLYELNDNPYAVLMVADFEGVICGFIDFWITFDVAQLNQIAVHEGLRRKGIGEVLLTDMINRVSEQEVTKITLEVRTHNEKAIALYQKHGFKEELIKKHYYDNGDDAIFMIKEVGE